MGRPRKPDPVKFCAFCNQTLSRKRYGKNLEDLTTFIRRKFCDATCMGKSKMLADPSKQALWQRARKDAVKADRCETCGSTAELDLHHKDGNPANNDSTNVMTLCDACHTKWHWQHGKQSRPPKPCVTCGKPARRNGYCQKHWFRFSKYGNPLLTKKRGGRHRELVLVSPDD